MKNQTFNENKSVRFFNMEELKSPTIDEHRNSASNATIRAFHNQVKRTDSIQDIYSDFIDRFTKCKSDLIQSQIEIEANAIEEEHNDSESDNEAERVLMPERVFWTREKMLTVRDKLKTLKNKIYLKTKNDFNNLNLYIDMAENDKIM